MQNNKLSMNYRAFSLLIGFIIWFLATLTFRVAGQYFFLTTNLTVIISLYLAVIPVLGLVATKIFNKYKLDRLQAIESSVIMVLPGMIFDTFCIEFFNYIFPNMQKDVASTFGSWLMWAYATVLVFGLIRKNKN